MLLNRNSYILKTNPLGIIHFPYGTPLSSAPKSFSPVKPDTFLNINKPQTNHPHFGGKSFQQIMKELQPTITNANERFPGLTDGNDLSHEKIHSILNTQTNTPLPVQDYIQRDLVGELDIERNKFFNGTVLNFLGELFDNLSNELQERETPQDQKNKLSKNLLNLLPIKNKNKQEQDNAFPAFAAVRIRTDNLSEIKPALESCLWDKKNIAVYSNPAERPDDLLCLIAKKGSTIEESFEKLKRMTQK